MRGECKRRSGAGASKPFAPKAAEAAQRAALGGIADTSAAGGLKHAQCHARPVSST